MKKQRSLKTVKELEEFGLIQSDEIAALQQVAEKFNLSITPAMVSLLVDAENQSPIKKQFLPSIDELQETPHELSDPIGDSNYEKVKGLVHRYPDRCLLKVVNVCPVYCRFCFRKEMIGPKKTSLTRSELQNAYQYIQNQREIWEVILTGGDPFILKPAVLGEILDSLMAIEHVEVIRIHTRVPVVDPNRVTDELISVLKRKKPVYVALHANHPDEFTEEAVNGCAKLVDAGIPMLSQSVLLKGVNDDVIVLTQLMRTFVRNRIKPYYLHHPDLAKGTSHFRMSIQKGQTLMKSLQGKISGLCQPTYVIEVPGGAGKVPISPCYARADNNNEWLLEDFHGMVHRYRDEW